MTNETVPAYVGRCATCHGIVYAHVYDDRAKAERSKVMAREIAACVRSGHQIGLETVGAVRTGKFCECIRRTKRQRTKQESLALWSTRTPDLFDLLQEEGSGTLRIYDGPMPQHPDEQPKGKLLASRSLTPEQLAEWERDRAEAEAIGSVSAAVLARSMRRSSTDLGLTAAEAARARKALRAPVVRALESLARELAAKAGQHGLTVAHLRLAGVQRGLLPPAGDGRQLSYLGAVLKSAGLVRTKDTRRSCISFSHGNMQRIWVAPEFSR